MPSAKEILFLLLAAFAAVFCTAWVLALTRRKEWCRPTVYQGFVGFVTCFFDTLGIGSYATTTALYRLRRTIPDEQLPGTLTVGHTVPTVVQAFLIILVIEVEMRTLTLLIGASVLGAWLGAGVVTRLPRRGIQVGMGLALLVTASLILARLLKVLPGGGNALGLDGWLLAAAVVGTFVIGALMTIGIGAYAPIMVMVSLMGMSEKTAFPIMMGSCAFLMSVAGLRFIRTGRYDARAALGLTLGGVPAVLLAVLVFKALDPGMVRWLVLAVVLHTAVSLLRAARAEHLRTPTEGTPSRENPPLASPVL